MSNAQQMQRRNDEPLFLGDPDRGAGRFAEWLFDEDEALQLGLVPVEYSIRNIAFYCMKPGIGLYVVKSRLGLLMGLKQLVAWLYRLGLLDYPAHLARRAVPVDRAYWLAIIRTFTLNPFTMGRRYERRHRRNG